MNKVCTLCGAEGHTAPNCPWAKGLDVSHGPGVPPDRIIPPEELFNPPEPVLVRQSRMASLAEAVVNTVVGLAIAMWATAAICWLHDIPMTWTNNFIITSWMTAISVGRSYLIRRAWNAEFWNVLKRKPKEWRARWRHRKIDPDLCCCGSQMGQGGSICHHGGCRSAREYAINCEVNNG